MMMLAHRLTLPTAVKIWFINRIPTDQLGKSIFLDSKFIIRYYKIGYLCPVHESRAYYLGMSLSSNDRKETRIFY